LHAAVWHIDYACNNTRKKIKAGTKQLKVAHVLLSPRIGGAETIVSSLDDGFKVRGVESLVIYLDDSGQKQNRLKRFLSLRRKLKQCGAENILAHSFLPAFYARLAAPRRSSVHYVLHSASDDYDSLSNRIIERVLLMRTKSVIAVSAQQLGVYLAHFRKNVTSTVINNGVSDALGLSVRIDQALIPSE
jgi:hypothetical protein